MTTIGHHTLLSESIISKEEIGNYISTAEGF